MAVSAINNYTNSMYYWQGQKLISSGSSSSASSSAASSLFSGTSMTNQISSMVELTKYAMDAMGVSSDSRVTFSQITKYAQQLQGEFNQGVKQGLKDSGILDMSSLIYTLDSSGKITVSGGSNSDCKKAQAWIDANPSYGETLIAALKKKNNIENMDSVQFSLTSSGKMTVLNKKTEDMQDFLDKNTDLTSTLREGLNSSGKDISYPLNMTFDGHNLKVKDNEEVNKWLEENPAFSEALRKELEKNNIELSSVSIRLGKEGTAQITVKDADLEDIQTVLDEETQTGSKIYSALANQGIDPDIAFTISFDENGALNIISDHPDRDKIQKFFEDNPELIKKYKQIEALAGIDDARKAMQISPNEMRKRIQIESLAVAWWSDSGNSNSYFGQYSNNNLSLLAGLNLNV